MLKSTSTCMNKQNQRLFGKMIVNVLYFFKKLLHVNFSYHKNKKPSDV